MFNLFSYKISKYILMGIIEVKYLRLLIDTINLQLKKRSKTSLKFLSKLTLNLLSNENIFKFIVILP